MPRTFIVTDLLFGDSGKGTVVDALVRKYGAELVVRYNGGAQAAHNVVTPDGRHHTFRQFGSGTFVPGVATLLSKHMLVDPLAAVVEASLLRDVGVTDALERLYVDEQAFVVTPYHKAMNRLRECSRGDKPHGTCGMGIGETANDILLRPDRALRVKDLLANDLEERLVETRKALWVRTKSFTWPNNPLTAEAVSLFNTSEKVIAEHYRRFCGSAVVASAMRVQALLNSLTSVFEGAQGVLLDQDCGFHPYTTWSKTTSVNARAILKEAAIAHPITEIGVLRTFATRHGPGPLVTEDAALDKLLKNEHNTTNEWQRDFRVGWLDLALLKYALMVNGPVNMLAVTHVDCLAAIPRWLICQAYTRNILRKPGTLKVQAQMTKALFKARYSPVLISKDHVLDTIQAQLQTPIGILSQGPTYLEKRFATEPEPVPA